MKSKKVPGPVTEFQDLSRTSRTVFKFKDFSRTSSISRTSRHPATACCTLSNLVSNKRTQLAKCTFCTFPESMLSLRIHFLNGCSIFVNLRILTYNFRLWLALFVSRY